MWLSWNTTNHFHRTILKVLFVFNRKKLWENWLICFQRNSHFWTQTLGLSKIQNFLATLTILAALWQSAFPVTFWQYQQSRSRSSMLSISLTIQVKIPERVKHLHFWHLWQFRNICNFGRSAGIAGNVESRPFWHLQQVQILPEFLWHCRKCQNVRWIPDSGYVCTLSTPWLNLD